MKQATKKRIDKLLESAKLRQTTPRRTILDALLNAGRPKTADEIISSIGKDCPNRVTVYRTLDALVDSGLVHSAFVSKRSRYFELADHCTKTQCHPHFVCTDCGQTRCLTEASVPLATKTPAGFVIHRQQVRLEGLCPTCGNEKSAKLEAF